MRGLAAAAMIMAAPVAAAVDPAGGAALLRDRAIAGNTAFAIVRDLTTEIGPRLAASAAEARARDWVAARMRAAGLARVHIQTFAVPHWERGVETATTIGAAPQRLDLTALGYSGATPAGGIDAEVVQFADLDALRAAGSLAGKIVFIDHAMGATQDGSSYGAVNAVRTAGPAIAGGKGAAAYLHRSLGTGPARLPHTGVTRFPDGVAPIPAAALSVPDAMQLMRLVARGPVRLHLVLTPRNLGPGTSGNVVGEVTGTGSDIVLTGGHLDSWDLGTGAIDDGTGIAIVTAAAKRIMAAGRPLRTIRIVWFGAEEPGLVGAGVYQKAHSADHYFAVAESDEGADRVWKIDTKLGADHAAEAEALFAATAPLGIVKGKTDTASGSDVEVMLDAGAPGVTLHQDATRYFDWHHTPDDTLDKIDPVQLRQNVAAYTAMLAVLSGGITEPKRPIRR